VSSSRSPARRVMAGLPSLALAAGSGSRAAARWDVSGRAVCPMTQLVWDRTGREERELVMLQKHVCGRVVRPARGEAPASRVFTHDGRAGGRACVRAGGYAGWIARAGGGKGSRRRWGDITRRATRWRDLDGGAARFAQRACTRRTWRWCRPVVRDGAFWGVMLFSMFPFG